MNIEVSTSLLETKQTLKQSQTTIDLTQLGHKKLKPEAKKVIGDTVTQDDYHISSHCQCSLCKQQIDKINRFGTDFSIRDVYKE